MNLIKTQRKHDCAVAAIATATGFSYYQVVDASLKSPEYFNENGLLPYEVDTTLAILGVPFFRFMSKEACLLGAVSPEEDIDSADLDDDLYRYLANSSSIVTLKGLIYLLRHVTAPALVGTQGAIGNDLHMVAWDQTTLTAYDPIGSVGSLDQIIPFDAYFLIGVDFPAGNMNAIGWRKQLLNIDWRELTEAVDLT